MDNNNLRMDSHETFFAAINKNESIRLKSTSGGVFSLLANYVLQKNGAVFGAAYNENQCVEHILVTEEANLPSILGAKYVQSSLGNVFPKVKELLESGKLVLFSGTPCQVGSLKVFLKFEYENLILVDFVCHGVPSQNFWDAYLEYRRILDNQKQIASSVNLRSKSTGWSNYNYSVEFLYASGFKYSKFNFDDSYMIAFVNDLILRPSCNNCKFKGVKRKSDFTLGDFWGVWDYKPYLNDNKGTSLVILHSSKAEHIWNDIKNSLIQEPITYEEAVAQNPAILYSSTTHPKRDELLSRIEAEGWIAVEEEVNKIRESRRESKSVLRKIKNKLRYYLNKK